MKPKKKPVRKRTPTRKTTPKKRVVRKPVSRKRFLRGVEDFRVGDSVKWGITYGVVKNFSGGRSGNLMTISTDSGKLAVVPLDSMAEVSKVEKTSSKSSATMPTKFKAFAKKCANLFGSVTHQSKGRHSGKHGTYEGSTYREGRYGKVAIADHETASRHKTDLQFIVSNKGNYERGFWIEIAIWKYDDEDEDLRYVKTLDGRDYATWDAFKKELLPLISDKKKH